MHSRTNSKIKVPGSKISYLTKNVITTKLILAPTTFLKVRISCPLFLPYTERPHLVTKHYKSERIYMYYTPLAMSHLSIIKVSLIGSH